MEEEFDIEKWRVENPMDYIMAMNLINQSDYKDEVFKSIYKVTRLHLPDLLYKYYSLSGNEESNEKKLNTVKSQNIYLSDIKDLNDPFDNMAYYYRASELKKHKWLAKYGGRLIDDFSSYVKVSSLTANGVNSMPMWAHYSNNHRGFYLSYDMKDEKNKVFGANTFPVQYTNTRIDVTDIMDLQAKKIFIKTEESRKRGNKITIYDDLSIVYMASFFCNIKHESWSYENEFRCTAGSIAKGMPFLPASPKAVYIGMNCSQIDATNLIGLANELHIPAHQMKFNEYDSDFNLSTKKLNKY